VFVPGDKANDTGTAQDHPLVLDNDATNAPLRKVRWLVISNKTVTPVMMTVVCDRSIEEGDVWVVGTGAMIGGAAKLAPQVLQVGVSTPAWSPTSPLLVTLSYRGDEKITCSFNLR
jgi:hypothetical protein